jgi:hypothetical protein
MRNLVRILSILACVAAIAATWFAYKATDAYLDGYVNCLSDTTQITCTR